MARAIDRFGRIVIPKPIRDRLGLVPGREVEIEVRDGVIEIRPVPIAVEITEVDGRPVAIPVGPVDVVDDETVREILDSVRR